MAAPKTGIMAFLAEPKGKGGPGKSGPPEPGYDGGGEVASALRDMFDSLKSGDDEGAALAFKRAKVACDEEDEEPDADEFGGMSDEEADDEE
jgi:hypothetical protein